MRLINDAIRNCLSSLIHANDLESSIDNIKAAQLFAHD